MAQLPCDKEPRTTQLFPTIRSPVYTVFVWQRYICSFLLASGCQSVIFRQQWIHFYFERFVRVNFCRICRACALFGLADRRTGGVRFRWSDDYCANREKLEHPHVSFLQFCLTTTLFTLVNAGLAYVLFRSGIGLSSPITHALADVLFGDCHPALVEIKKNLFVAAWLSIVPTVSILAAICSLMPTVNWVTEESLWRYDKRYLRVDSVRRPPVLASVARRSSAGPPVGATRAERARGAGDRQRIDTRHHATALSMPTSAPSVAEHSFIL